MSTQTSVEDRVLRVSDENQLELLDNEHLPTQLARFLSAPGTVKEACLNLLHVMSQSERGRAKIIVTFDMTRWVNVTCDVTV